MKLLEVVNGFWILQNGEQPTGLLFEREKHYILLNGDEKKEFETFEKFLNSLGVDLQNFLVMKENDYKQKKNLDGYPVKDEHEIVLLDDNPKFTKEEKEKIISLGYPIYTRGTEVIFVAGYWAIFRENETNGSNSWNIAFCPKLETILKTKHSGPFTSRAAAQQEASFLSKKEKRRIQSQ